MPELQVQFVTMIDGLVVLNGTTALIVRELEEEPGIAPVIH